MRTPLTVVTGALGSGKTTLLRQILEQTTQKLAILMNEFGELAIDSRILEGKNVRMAELAGGCVCCSLIGEFEAAVTEILDTVAPDAILVETTGVAEPDALILDIEDGLSQVRLDGVIVLVDADALVRFPHLGHTTRQQIQAADVVILNKVDLVSAETLPSLEHQVRSLNPQAAVVRTERARIPPDLLFGLGRERQPSPPSDHLHEIGLESFDYHPRGTMDRVCFEQWADSLPEPVYRAKGFVRFAEGMSLFNFVAGRWELEPFPAEQTGLVFIGDHVLKHKEAITDGLRACEQA